MTARSPSLLVEQQLLLLTLARLASVDTVLRFCRIAVTTYIKPIFHGLTHSRRDMGELHHIALFASTCIKEQA